MAQQTFTNQEIEDNIKSLLWTGQTVARPSEEWKPVHRKPNEIPKDRKAKSNLVDEVAYTKKAQQSKEGLGQDSSVDSASTKKKKKKKPKKKRIDTEQRAGNKEESNMHKGKTKHNSKNAPRDASAERAERQRAAADAERLRRRFPSLSIEEPKPDNDVLMELEKDYIFPLKKKSTKFPLAKYFCRLCEYHCDTVAICQKHMKDTRHKRLRVIKTTDILLKSLPLPSKPHQEALTKLVRDVYITQSLSNDEMQQRQEVFANVSELVHSKFPEAKLTMYGSIATGLALKHSDLNIDVSAAEAAKILTALHLMLKNDDTGYYEQVQSNFSAKVPCVYFRISGTDIKCHLSINSQIGCQTTQLIKCYMQIDPRVQLLTVVFRYWAKLVHIDDQDKGTLPPYVFGLMVIYFLQQCQPPILPILHELKKDGKVPQDGYYNSMESLKNIWQTENEWSLGELWFNLLKFYSTEFDISRFVVCIRQKAPLPRDEKKWSSKKLAIEDPYAKKRNVARSVSHSHVFEYIYDRLRAAFLYFGVPQTASGPLYTEVDTSKLENKLRRTYKKMDDKVNGVGLEKKEERRSEQKQSESQRTSDLEDNLELDRRSSGARELEQYIKDESEADCRTQEIIKQLEAMNIEDNYTEKFVELLVEDVIRRSLEEVRSRQEQKQFKDVPSDELNNVDDCVKTENLSENAVESKGPETPEKMSVVSATEDTDSDSSEDEVAEPEPVEHGERGGKLETEKSARSSESPESKDGSDEGEDSLGLQGLCDDQLSKLSADDLSFRFNEETLSDGKGPAVMCSICQTEGHLKQNCPEENLPELKPLPTMTATFKALLEDILFQVPGDFEPSKWEKKNRTTIIKEIESFIRDDFPEAKLSLFGSSVNGFGFQNSDLDICMTLGAETAEDLPCVEIIEKLAKKLRTNRSLYDVIPICTAKVPIVKFKHRRSGLEGDISLYNTLAQHNTKMLQLYSEIDYRVKVLGYTMKVFAKLCDMCDASRGSLSSYAYIIMVLYFLQQRKPPVIPVLQELHDKDERPLLMVDGWNAWYFDSLDDLKSDWQEYGQNKESLADLWLGMLRFYTEEFNFRDYVISIRQLAPLTRFEKLWNGKCLAIEDPFDLNHNLGGGVSRKMNTYIMKAFINARTVFGTPVDHDRIPDRYPSMQDYLFDKYLLTEGEPPNDRGCRICGKIGHFAKECPRVFARKERQEREREQRKQERLNRQEKELLREQQDRDDSRQKEKTDKQPKQQAQQQQKQQTQRQQSAPQSQQQRQKSASQGQQAAPPRQKSAPQRQPLATQRQQSASQRQHSAPDSQQSQQQQRQQRQPRHQQQQQQQQYDNRGMAMAGGVTGGLQNPGTLRNQRMTHGIESGLQPAAHQHSQNTNRRQMNKRSHSPQSYQPQDHYQDHYQDRGMGQGYRGSSRGQPSDSSSLGTSGGRPHSPQLFYNSSMKDHMLLNGAWSYGEEVSHQDSGSYTWQQERFLPQPGYPGQHKLTSPSFPAHPAHPTHSSMPHPHHQQQGANMGSSPPYWLAQQGHQSYMYGQSPPNTSQHNPSNWLHPKWLQEESSGGFTWQQQASFLKSENMAQGHGNPHQQRKAHPQSTGRQPELRLVSSGKSLEVTVNNEYFHDGHTQHGGAAHRHGSQHHQGHHGNRSQKYNEGRNYNR